MSETHEAHREAIARRIRALLNRTEENGCTEAEALAAAEKARALMDAHRLSQSDVEIEAEPIADEWIERGTEYRLTPADKCLWAIDHYCGVKTWYQFKENRRGAWARHVRLLGLKSDVEMAVYLYRLIERAIETESERYNRRYGPTATPHGTLRRNTSFRVGMANRIASRLKAMADALEATTVTGSGTALVVVRGHVVDAALDRLGIRFSGSLSGPRARDRDAYDAGHAAGDRVNLSRPVGGAATGRIGRGA